jgi:hypothetical protein
VVEYVTGSLSLRAWKSLEQGSESPGPVQSLQWPLHLRLGVAGPGMLPFGGAPAGGAGRRAAGALQVLPVAVASS